MCPSGHVDQCGFLLKGIGPSLGLEVIPEAVIEAPPQEGEIFREIGCLQGGRNCGLAIPHSIIKGHKGEGRTLARSTRRGNMSMQATRCHEGGKRFVGE